MSQARTAPYKVRSAVLLFTTLPTTSISCSLMADKNIHEVSWKWGASEPTGTVAEMKTEGKLEIETKGKLVHKNADPSNPAVHVERAGNDVVKRASELTKLSSSAEGGKVEAPTTEEHQVGEEERQESKSHGKPAPKKRAPRKKSNAAAVTGDKRAADEAADGAKEEFISKKTKKAKTIKADDDGEKKGRGRPRKDSKAKKTQAEKTQEEGEAMDVAANAPSDEGTTVPKKRGHPKKSESGASDHPSIETALVDANSDAPATNTRSRD
ncbi:hypothetical protein J132_04985 [Termitomyces sp. J132]|nr:hypothetical protein J132_04985 [Termitomyces sp. J132]